MKWPKIPHLPNSPGVTKDDTKLESDSHFHDGSLLIVTEKLDGENTSLFRDRVHARSEESNHHESQSWLKQFHASFAYLIPSNIQIVGENMYAKHSIFYDKLTSYFYVFAIIDLESEKIMSWETTTYYCDMFNLQTVPFFEGNVSHFGPTSEGYVIRKASSFPVKEIDKNMAKYVRKDHVQTDKHWKTSWIPNKLSGATS